MPPPTAQPLATRILLGPALRTQSDHRLVRLVREGYEAAFEEIVRRYRRPLDRFAAAIVGPRAEDVTQDAFSKALLALRGSENEIELRPWLYRIVRNTALNDLRDRPPAADELSEATFGGGLSAAAEAERREEMSDLIRRLQALPEPQRAAIVMRELEGLSHDEIAAALGVSGGAARQAIHRARTSLRDGLGLLLPLPLLRTLIEGGGELAGGAAAGGASAGGVALSSLGGGAAAKIGVATVLLAGTVGAGIAVEHDRGRSGSETAEAATLLAAPGAGAPASGQAGPSGQVVGGAESSPAGDGHGSSGHSGESSGGRNGQSGSSGQGPGGSGEGGSSHSGSTRHHDGGGGGEDESGDPSGKGGRDGGGGEDSQSGSGSGRRSPGGDDGPDGGGEDSQSGPSPQSGDSGGDSSSEDPPEPTQQPEGSDGEDSGPSSELSSDSGSSSTDSLSPAD